MKFEIKELIIVGFLGAFGGLINTLTGKPPDEKYNWKIAIPEMIIAVFAGFLAYWTMKGFEVSDNYQIVGISLAGYSARGVLNIFNKLFIEKLKNFRFLWLLLPAVLLLGGCRTVYYTDGTVKSEGWDLGTEGHGSYGLIVIHVDSNKKD